MEKAEIPMGQTRKKGGVCTNASSDDAEDADGTDPRSEKTEREEGRVKI